MGGLILGVNTLYRVICFFKLFPMVGKGCLERVKYCLRTSATYQDAIWALENIRAC